MPMISPIMIAFGSNVEAMSEFRPPSVAVLGDKAAL